MSLGDASMPLFWRPKLTICGRLRNLKNGRTLHSCSVTEKMPWREYLLGSINWRLAFGELTGASHTQMQKLLHLASIRLLQRLVKSL